MNNKTRLALSDEMFLNQLFKSNYHKKESFKNNNYNSSNENDFSFKGQLNKVLKKREK